MWSVYVWDNITGEDQTMSPVGYYSYKPILEEHHIRVLRLYQSSSTDPFCCSLIQAHIDEMPTYEALFYVWGDSTPKHTMLGEDQHLPIADNLHTALVYLRHEDKPCCLWIDAIFINQNDFEKLNQEVLLMSEI